MKRRTKVVALATSLLVGVSMMGVGFASWIISNQVSETATGNVKAEAVSDKTIEFSADVTSAAKDIVFGAYSESDNKGWLTNDDTAAGNLSVTITLTFKAGGVLSSLTVADTYANAGSESGWNFTTAVSEGYITGPTYSALTLTGDFEESGITLSAEGAFSIPKEVELEEGGTIALTVSYDWGTKFGSQNPYIYYNTKTASDYVNGSEGQTWSENALAELNALYNYLGGDAGTAFTFTFTAN